MFLHQHPYEPFLPEGADRLIVGTLPPPRFSLGRLREEDVNFCYGSRDGLLWPVLERVYQTSLHYQNDEAAVMERKQLLTSKGVGVFDIVASAKREKIDASDLGMQDVELRNLTGALSELTKVKALLFTGGNSKNGPEYFFRKHLKARGIQLKRIANEIPRIHQFDLDSRTIYTVSLTAPSGSANRAIGGMDAYKMKKAKDPSFTTLDFRVQQYTPYFREAFWELL
ncbi:uracil-DNA glycosylase family protein [Robertkochia sediminum]|uniref:uracil-DNA glycosylase family protein n=1 Tax=Robertkochia sediminum TaxID=2785326 RepID=UPI001931653F|nr:uracil-DNA glycosylase family protein [Robertkochia sediminum]MBL7471625.1 uracil-DNA glycosylase family protein [Robertkochia sediminum]